MSGLTKQSQVFSGIIFDDDGHVHAIFEVPLYGLDDCDAARKDHVHCVAALFGFQSDAVAWLEEKRAVIDRAPSGTPARTSNCSVQVQQMLWFERFRLFQNLSRAVAALTDFFLLTIR